MNRWILTCSKASPDSKWPLGFNVAKQQMLDENRATTRPQPIKIRPRVTKGSPFRSISICFDLFSYILGQVCESKGFWSPPDGNSTILRSPHAVMTLRDHLLWIKQVHRFAHLQVAEAGQVISQVVLQTELLGLPPATQTVSERVARRASSS